MFNDVEHRGLQTVTGVGIARLPIVFEHGLDILHYVPFDQTCRTVQTVFEDRVRVGSRHHGEAPQYTLNFSLRGVAVIRGCTTDFADGYSLRSMPLRSVLEEDLVISCLAYRAVHTANMRSINNEAKLVSVILVVRGNAISYEGDFAPISVIVQ